MGLRSPLPIGGPARRVAGLGAVLVLFAGCGRDDAAPDTGPRRDAEPDSAAVAGEAARPESSELDTTGASIPGADTLPSKAAGADSLAALVAGAPALGPADAAVVILEFSDFECPFCQRAHETVRRLMRDRPDARLVYVQFPILSLHPNAMLPAEASLEAHRQGKFWEYHDALFEIDPPLERDALVAAAREVGLDVAALERALDARTHRPQVQAEMLLGESLAVTGTPTFFLNGYRLVGAQPYEAFVTAFNVLLRASRRDGAATGAAPRTSRGNGAAG